VLVVTGVGALAVGVLLAAGHGVSSSYVYLQALGPGVGALLLVHALGQLPEVRAAPAAPLSGLRIAALAIALVSLFWGTAEYANSRGLTLARELASNLTMNPSVTIFSKTNLNIKPSDYAGDTRNVACDGPFVKQSPKADYRYRYDGFTLLLRSDGKYFVTPTPTEQTWYPPTPSQPDPVLVLPDDNSIRIELQRGATYPAHTVEATAAGPLTMSCSPTPPPAKAKPRRSKRR